MERERSETAEVPVPEVVRRSIARMVLGIEEHPVTRQNRRVNDPSQATLELSYYLDGQTATFTVDPLNNAVIVGGGEGAVAKLLPGPLANDLLVVLGEEINTRTRGRRLDPDSDSDRTVSIGVAECLVRMGRGTSTDSYNALIETARRLALLRIVARGGAWRTRKGRIRSEVIFGLVDQLEIVGREDSPAGARLNFTLSKPFASRLQEDFRPLETGTYWRLGSDPARRLYRLLDNAFHLLAKRHGARPEVVRVPVHHLRDRLPIDESKTFQIQRKLDRYHEALVETGFLAAMPTYEPTLAEDLRDFPAYPGKSAKLTSAVYRIVSPLPPKLRLDTPPATAAAAPHAAPLELLGVRLPAPASISDLADRMSELMSVLPGAARHIGLCKVACEVLPDDDAFRLALSTARQEHGELSPTTKFILEVKAILTRRGIPVPPKLLSRDAQRVLLDD